MKPLFEILNQVSAPSRYLPLEYQKSNKDLTEAKVKVALAFPDLYELGMSHLGVRILYHLLNQEEGIACERAYAPAPDLEKLLRERHQPLFSHESQTPLLSFDLIGFSLTYELCYTNVLAMLDLAGIPLLARDRRGGKWPLILGGGPCASNPEPIADFFDAFLFGDGEEAVLELCASLREWKEAGGSREELLERWAKIPGVYVPEFFEPEYDQEGNLRGIRPPKAAPEKVRRRIVRDLDQAYFPDRPLTPVVELVHDRVMIEVARGCARGCRFCHAGIIYRPVRERSAPRVLELARQSLASTGYEECSLLSLSASDYSCLSEVLVSLVREHYDSRVSVSLPSLRVQGLSDRVIEAIESVKKTGFTLAPEAGTERLRRVINKWYPESELRETAERVFAHGWRNLKLYFMVGLPTETEDDLRGIIRLTEEISHIRGAQGRPQVSLSLSGFVPKPHTPFQWESQAPVERLRQIQEWMRQEFQGRGKRVKWGDPRMSELEGVFSRGDRRLAAVILRAFQSGLRFDGWSEHFNYEGWQKAFQESGISPAFYTTRPRRKEEVFPWEHLDAGVTRDWLWEERERAYQELTTPDCRESGCVNPCGVCAQEIQTRLASPPTESEEEMHFSAPEKKTPEVFFLYRLQYARREAMRFLSQLEVTRLFTRAVRRAGLPIRYSQGFHPLPRIIFGPAPPVGVASEAEFLDLELIRRLSAEEILSRLQAVMPAGIFLLAAKEIPMRSSPVSSVITGYDYEIRRREGLPAFDPEAAARFLAQETFLIKQQREKGEREVDLRSRVRFLTIEEGGLRLGLRVMEGPGVKPQEVVMHVFGWSEEEVRQLEITRVAAHFKTAKPVRYPGQAERSRKVRTPRGSR